MKNKKNLFLTICTIILLPLLLTGCFNYHDINKVTFPTSVIFDINDLGEAVIYLDCIKPYRSTNDSSDKGRRIIYKGEGRTAMEALEDINRASSYKLNYSQTRAYIFTEKAAKNGIKKFLDLINNNSEFQVKPSAFIYYGDVDDLLSTVSADEEYLGLFLNDLVGKEKYNSKAVKSNINYYLSNVLMGGNTALLTSIELKENALDKKIEIDGASIFKDNILIEKINIENSLMYNILMGTAKTGILEATNPNSKSDFISLEIIDSNVKDNLSYENGAIKLIKDIEVDVSVSEIQGSLIVDSSALDYIRYNEEEYINGYVKYIFNKYNIKGFYSLYEIERENIDKALESMRILGIEGVNITIPYKEKFLNKIDFLSKEAEEIGAINVLKIEKNRFSGYNSDYYGFIRLLERGKIEIKDKKCVVLGTGGGAKAIIVALKDLGAKEIVVVSRSREGKIEKLKERFSYINVATYEDRIDGDAIVNCTPVGMYPNVENSPVSEEVVKRFESVVDIIYNPLQTKFLYFAEKNGIKNIDGLFMLIEQAIKAEEIWQEREFDKKLGEELYQKLALNFK